MKELPQPFANYDSDSGGHKMISEGQPEANQAIHEQITSYFTSLRTNLHFDTQALETAYKNESLLYPTVEITDRAVHTVTEAVTRNNQMADIISSQPYQEILSRERTLRGKSAIGKIICIDGRLTPTHTSGQTEGVHESIAGCVNTSISKLTGYRELKSQTLERAIEERPYQDASQILEKDEAHAQVSYRKDGNVEVISNCGGMLKYQTEAAERGEPFETDDLVAENFKLMAPAIEAITRKYNASARNIGQHELEKVVIRTVFDTQTQGVLLGYGEDQPLFFTSSLLEELEDDIFHDLKGNDRLRQPGFYRASFTQIGRFLDKEKQTADLIEYFLENSTFTRSVMDATNRLEELQGLTQQQIQALSFSLAKNMSFQWLTGLYKKELTEDHPFNAHHEQFQAITLDDGYDATVGRNDPEVQVFAANTATIPEAVDHIKTKILLMDHYADSKPYVLFICSGIAENAANDADVRKQARTTVGRTFKGITHNDEIAQAVKSGILIPVPAILTSRSNRIIEVPNLLQ